MDIVDVKILENSNTILKLVHRFDKTIPVMEIKRRLAGGEIAVSFDLDAYDWVEQEPLGVSQFDWEMRFYAFLEEIQATGAGIELYKDGRPESMEYLKNWINTREGIRRDCEEYPD